MKFINVMKKHAATITTGVTAAVASASSFAVTVPESIEAAVTSGQSNYSLVVVGLITMAAVGFGLRMIVGAMK
ncbi:hypothetical protein DEB41_17480 (plasmid) [Vibrio anguillarum]|uniref:Phage coat protein n=4 Tax=root TaxID=1 RepID=A0A1E5FNN1_VIBAN|nr:MULTISPECIES: hypothetical protein [Vibrio]YP_010768640.1 putative major coat protein [Vibrio phage VAI1]QFG06231.1 putative major coat protein [Vibrio phage VAI2]ASW80992.1 hypothetical protein CK207_07675 [Vibrio anguillarum]AXN09293.1 hypothetical protein DEA53_17685 [Vibrio anguillarum]AXN12694.1 hypothetical protein DEB26_17435 [Vibrio anguillarum]AXN16097.1 hypothetical protein DEB41_17480 [Vibrio anguillarum]